MKTVSVESIPVDKVKETIKANIGHHIEILEHNKQGKLLHRYRGVIEGAYDNVLVVKLDLQGYTLNKSFTYVDFSIGELKFTIID